MRFTIAVGAAILATWRLHVAARPAVVHDLRHPLHSEEAVRNPAQGVPLDVSSLAAEREQQAAVRSQTDHARQLRIADGAAAAEGPRTVLVTTVDGRVHALDSRTGEKHWSFSTGDPLLKLNQQTPGVLDAKRWLVPALDGTLLMHTPQGLQSLGITVNQLQEKTPFRAPTGGTFYTGSRVSKVYGVDAVTGAVLQTFSGSSLDKVRLHALYGFQLRMRERKKASLTLPLVCTHAMCTGE